MPTPPRTSLDAIVTAGRAILETHGLAGLTMQATARAVGVKAPSLYKHVADRDALVGLIADAAALDLAERLAAQDGLAGLARELRAWARAHQEAYRLAFSGRGSEQALATAAAPVLATTRALVGEESALDAARLVTAWATGFLSMELAGAFRLGGSVDDAFEYGLDRLTAALSR
ncbi:TetR-like C-terminal domain-containing protein [Demequina sp.]|uniref:TetR/AcrR family transcriptional regulator n=1 Tax=Demequina sp. TaxID=2050685 RepID=UPI0025BDEFC3|nr:TetR-like C-terminal domain-containing protein [Demequina sp.]